MRLKLSKILVLTVLGDHDWREPASRQMKRRKEEEDELMIRRSEAEKRERETLWRKGLTSKVRLDIEEVNRLQIRHAFVVMVVERRKARGRSEPVESRAQPAEVWSLRQGRSRSENLFFGSSIDFSNIEQTGGSFYCY